MATAVALRRVGNRLASAKSKTGLPQCSQAASAWARHQATPAIFAILARCRTAARMRGQAGLERKLAGEGGSEAKAQHLEHRIARGMAEGTLTAKERMAKAKELRSKLVESRHARAMRHPQHLGPAIPESRRTVAASTRTVKAHGPIPAAKLGSVESIRLTGKTYEHRERIAALGAHWDASHKAWVVPGHAIKPELHGQIARDLADLHKGGVKVEANLAMVHRKAKYHSAGTLAAAHVAKVVRPAQSPKPTAGPASALMTPTVGARELAEKNLTAEGAPASALVTARIGKVKQSMSTRSARHVAPVQATSTGPITYHATRLHDLTQLTAHFVHGTAPPPKPLEGRRASLRGGRPVVDEPWAFARMAALENRARAKVKAAAAAVESNPLVGGKRAKPGYADVARKLDRALDRQKRLGRVRAKLSERFTSGYARGAVYTGD